MACRPRSWRDSRATTSSTRNGRIHVNVLKVQHHGALANVETEVRQAGHGRQLHLLRQRQPRQSRGRGRRGVRESAPDGHRRRNAGGPAVTVSLLVHEQSGDARHHRNKEAPEAHEEGQRCRGGAAAGQREPHEGDVHQGWPSRDRSPMNRWRTLVAAALLMTAGGIVALSRAPQPALPAAYKVPPALNDGWATASVDAVGIDRAAIERMTTAIRENPGWNVHAVLIERDGHLVYEEVLQRNRPALGNFARHGNISLARRSTISVQ